MNVLVLGAGKVGYGVARELSRGENSVTVVDSSEIALSSVANRLDVRTVLGHASDISVLKEAGIEKTEILIAVTSSDEVNITACQIANFISNVGMKIARINAKSYLNEQDLFKENRFSIDFVVSSAVEMTKMVKRMVSIPSALDVAFCAGDRLRAIGVTCKKNSPISDIQLKYLQSVDPKSCIAILLMKHALGEWFIPTNNDVIQPNDEIYFICSSENVPQAMELFGYAAHTDANIVFIGGNNLCEEIVSSMPSDDISIKVIESDLSRIEELTKNLNNVEILQGEPCDTEVLEFSGIRDSGLVISSTNDDKVNILSSLLAKKLGAKRVATILNDSSYSDILHSLGINSVLDSRGAVVSKILHYIHEANVENILSFSEAEIKVFATDVLNNSYAVGTLTDDMNIESEVYIPVVLREDKIFVSPKKLLLNAGDKVLFVAQVKAIDKLLNLFQEKPKYLL